MWLNASPPNDRQPVVLICQLPPQNLPCFDMFLQSDNETHKHGILPKSIDELMSRKVSLVGQSIAEASTYGHLLFCTEYTGRPSSSTQWKPRPGIPQPMTCHQECITGQRFVGQRPRWGCAQKREVSLLWYSCLLFFLCIVCLLSLLLKKYTSTYIIYTYDTPLTLLT